MKNLYGKFVYSLLFCVLSFFLCNISFAQPSADQAKKERVFFIASGGNATIKPVGNETYQITFHKISNVTFVSFAPSNSAGKIGIRQFAEEIWSNQSEANVTASVTGVFAAGETRKTYVFTASNPSYNVTAHDFSINVVGFGGKTQPIFKAGKEVKISDVALRIDGLKISGVIEKIKAEAAGTEEEDVAWNFWN